ncbi:MAG: response regulator transcription factor [Deltaproteobacteria bacterium]|nr:response regulator transcription factor [Deltaproteobacteria bacterium]
MLKRPEIIDIVIADKSPVVVGGLRQVFAEDGRFRVVASAVDGERFMEAVAQFQFDIGVIGWDMPYMDAREVLQRLRGHATPPRILIYTGNSNPDLPRQAMALGAAGFCGKSESAANVLAAAVAIHSGRMMFPFVDVRRLNQTPLGDLTPREHQLLASLADGRSNSQLSRELDISQNTVKFHLKNLFEKLGVNNRTEAVVLFLRSHSPKSSDPGR